MGGLPPHGSQLTILGKKTSMIHPFTGGKPLYSRKIYGQHPVGGESSNSISFSMREYPPIGS
jgi:hypothetical protein